jgi:hypothetical protein
MTAAQALERLETLPLRDDPRMAEALNVLRARVTPKLRKPKSCPLAAAALKVCKRPPSWSETPHHQRSAYLDTFEDREAQEVRLRALELEENSERTRQFTYERPKQVKTDDELGTYLRAIVGTAS